MSHSQTSSCPRAQCSGFLHGLPITPAVPFRAYSAFDNLHSPNQQEEPVSENDLGPLEELPDWRPHSPANPLLTPPSLHLQKGGTDKTPLSSQQKAHQRYRQKRLAKRQEIQLADTTTLKAISVKKRSASASQKVAISLKKLSLKKKPASTSLTVSTSSCSYKEGFVPSKPAWMGQPDVKEEREYSLQELVEVHRMTVIAWDGRECRPIVDMDEVVVGLLGAVPIDDGWDEVCKKAEEALEEAAGKLSISVKDQFHRRGAFPAFNFGLSHGGGQCKPGLLLNGHHNSPILQELVENPMIQRLARLPNYYFKAYAPRLYAYYMETIDHLISRYPNSIKRSYEGAAFAAMSFNLGPRTVSFPHRDFANLSWGWCAITSLGDFNPDKGGHLVLWDLKLAIRFPRGSCIIIPSAMVRHSNASIGETEKRYSIAQYSAAGLFRWVDNGFILDDEWFAKASEAEKKERLDWQKLRWSAGLLMLSNLSELTN